MAEFEYQFKNDYNKPFKVNDAVFYCYSSGSFKSLYFDANDRKVVGEVLPQADATEDVIGTFLLKEKGLRLPIVKSGTYKGLRYSPIGYACVGHHKYVCIIKKLL